MMGDINTVTVLEMAHRKQLLNAGAHMPLLLPRGTEFGDVYIDDLVLLSMLYTALSWTMREGESTKHVPSARDAHRLIKDHRQLQVGVLGRRAGWDQRNPRLPTE